MSDPENSENKLPSFGAMMLARKDRTYPKLRYTALDDDPTPQSLAGQLAEVWPVHFECLAERNEKCGFSKVLGLMDAKQVAILSDTFGLLNAINEERSLVGSGQLRSNLIDLLVSLEETRERVATDDELASVESFAFFLHDIINDFARLGLTVEGAPLSEPNLSSKYKR